MSDEWVNSCGWCGKDHRLVKGWLLWITTDDGTDVYTRLCQTCNSFAEQHGIKNEFVSQDSKFEP